MTKAHKCILVDLWWNEAIQVQAFCRLLRHGQTERVECVKMVVQGSVDAYMLDLQERKTKEINNTMGEDKLQQRDTMVDLLKLFADVSKDEQGRLTLKSKSRRTRGAWKNAFSSKDSHSRTA
ncbi:hypothetical protein BJY04DRAFT_176447 [Aspergillus karnatakaensis]|uniref:putative SNF2 family helicase n=1 Tax=Aspergillus karnatakaensis TaxID=1810916 RepID=UPI003CCE2013